MARSTRWGTALGIASLCMALSTRARVHAEPPPLEACVERLDDARVAQLLAWTERSLADQRLGSALWFAGWTAFNLTNVSIGAWRIAVADQQIQRDSWMLAAIGAGGFVIGASLLPPPGLYAARRLRRMSAASPAQRREKLRRALVLLERANDFETRNTSLVTHLGGLLYGGISIGYLYLHNRHAEDRHAVHVYSWIQFASTVVGAEATIWSVPRRARRDVAHVRRHVCPEPTQHSAREGFLQSVSIQVVGSSAGLRFRF